jgi:zinc protease
LNYYNHYLGDPGYLPKDLEHYESVTTEGVKAAAQKLTVNSRVVVYGVPGKKVINDVPKRDDAALKQPTPAPEPDKPEQAWRAHPPQPGPALALNLPAPEEFKLNNGLTVLLSQQHSLPTVSASMVVLSGSERNPSDRPGLAGFTAAMLQEGTEKRNALQLADDTDQVGAALETNSNSDRSSVTIRGLSKNADSEFELVSDVVLHPAFREADLERVRKQRVTALLQQQENPYTLVAKFFNLNLYGEHHPYAYLEEGTKEATESTTRSDLEKFYRAGYAPQDSALVIAGDLTLPQAKAMAEKYFGDWSGSASAAAPPQGAGTLKRHVVLVDRPGANQTMVRIGEVGVARNNPDYPALEVTNAILGGLFSSRVNLNLREAHGYTYGAFSRFQYHRGPGPFFVNSAIRTDVTAPAIEETFKEIDRMRTSEPSAEEMSLSKDSITRSLAGDFEANNQVTNLFGGLFVYGLPLDYYRTFPAKVDAVNAGDVQKMAKEYMQPDSMLVVAVGDRAKIGPGLEKLGLGSVQAFDVSGKPLAEGAAAQGTK